MTNKSYHEQVVVFNGQLDLIVDTIGTNVWVQKLKWNGLKSWNNAARKPLYDSGENIHTK